MPSKNKILMNPLNTHLPVVHLKGGELHFSQKPELVYTVLGSCISISMFYPKFKMAAICHSFLPQENYQEKKTQNKENYRYLDQAFNAMCNWYLNHGVKCDGIILKVFGGGKLVKVNNDGCQLAFCDKSVGIQNIDAALRLIISKNIKISAGDFGGDSSRVLYFYTDTGEVLIKRTKRLAIPNELL